MRRAALALVLLAAPPAFAEAVRRPMSYVDRRYETTVRQLLDFTCGAASLATILRHYWGEDIGEKQVLDRIRARYDAAQWRAKQSDGMSFDDLAQAAQSLGYEARGAGIAADELGKLDAPVIVHLDKGKFQHFSVLKRAVDGVFYLSDPILGAIGMPAHEFRKQYTGKALAVARKASDLPANAPLARVRDGLSVRDSLRGVVDRPPQHPAAGFN